MTTTWHLSGGLVVAACYELGPAEKPLLRYPSPAIHPYNAPKAVN